MADIVVLLELDLLDSFPGLAFFAVELSSTSHIIVSGKALTVFPKELIAWGQWDVEGH